MTNPQNERLIEIRNLLRPFVRDDDRIDEIGPTTALDALGVDSARIIDVVLSFEERFSRPVTEEEESGLESVADLLALLD